MSEIKLTSKEETLKNFMLEFFDYNGLRKIGVYDRTIKKNNYQAQADRICEFFGYGTVFEYGAKEVRCHLSEGKTKVELTIIKNIYESF